MRIMLDAAPPRLVQELVAGRLTSILPITLTARIHPTLVYIGVENLAPVAAPRNPIAKPPTDLSNPYNSDIRIRGSPAPRRPVPDMTPDCAWAGRSGRLQRTEHRAPLN